MEEDPPLKGCCAWVDNLSAEAGTKGFALLPARMYGRRCFVLQARSVDETWLRLLMQPPARGKEAMRVAISMELLLRYCPYCARPFSELIEAQLAEFDAAND